MRPPTWRRVVGVVLVVLLAATAAACRRPGGGGGGGDDGAAEFRRLLRGTEDAPWDVRVGVEQITITDARPGQPLTLYGPRARERLTLLADDAGQAHVAYLPPEPATVQSGPTLDMGALDAVHGTTVEPGRYAVVDESATPRLATEVLTVPDRDDVPDQGLYDRQSLAGVELDVLGNVKPGSAIDDGFQYVEMRDGVLLSANVRFPDTTSTDRRPGPRSSSTRGTAPPTRRARRRACASPAPSATPRCRSTCAAPGARAACSTCSTPRRWPTATT